MGDGWGMDEGQWAICWEPRPEGPGRTGVLELAESEPDWHDACVTVAVLNSGCTD